MARERKRGTGLALVAAKQARVIADRERQRAAKRARLCPDPKAPWWARERTPGRR
jgi:hypothetical protein